MFSYCNKDETESVDVGISHTTTVCNILCVHYELRSAGSVERTLRYGALTNFQNLVISSQCRKSKERSVQGSSLVSRSLPLYEWERAW